MKALQQAGHQPRDIDAVIISTCTGYLCPGLTSYVAEQLGLRQDALALDLVGQGCGAALPNLRTASDAGVVAERLLRDLREPMQLALNSLVVTPSIGIAICPQDGTDADTLLRNADLAMYFAKRKNPGTLAFYDVAMNAAALQPLPVPDGNRLATLAISFQGEGRRSVHGSSCSGR